MGGRVTVLRIFNNLQICTRVYICLAQMSAHRRAPDSRGDQMENTRRCVYSGFCDGGEREAVGG